MAWCETLILVIVIIAILIIVFKLYLILSTGWDRSPTCLVGKTAIVTGSNTGIGYYTALDFAKRGARVILACRDPRRAEEAKSKIIEATGNPNVEVKILNLSSLNSVRQFANNVKNSEKRLDILVNNAGAGCFEHTLTQDGLSMSMQINHFGPFLLTILLIELLKKSAPSRIVMVSSDLAMLGNINVDDLNAFPRKPFGKVYDYSNTKLCNLLFCNELARRLKGSGVDANSIYPGAVQTDFLRKMTGPSAKTIQFIQKCFYKQTEAGAQTSIYASVSKDIAGVSGECFSDCKQIGMVRAARDLNLAKRVWEKSEEFVKLSESEKVI